MFDTFISTIIDGLVDGGREHIWFHAAFLSQVIVISWFYPSKMLDRMQQVMGSYPPSAYPKLYPASIEDIGQRIRTYKVMNGVAFGVGIGLLLHSLYTPAEELLGWDDQAVLLAYFMLQAIPFLYLEVAGFSYFRLMRKTHVQAQRTASLQPRRLSDFAPRWMIWTATAVYFGFVALVLYFIQDPFDGFAGYINLVGISLINAVFLGVIGMALYGKKSNPHQAPEDRTRHITFVVRNALMASIAGSVFLGMVLLLQSWEMHEAVPRAMSIYFQILILMSLPAFSVHDVNYDVYKKDPAPSV